MFKGCDQDGHDTVTPGVFSLYSRPAKSSDKAEGRPLF